MKIILIIILSISFVNFNEIFVTVYADCAGTLSRWKKNHVTVTKNYIIG